MIYLAILGRQPEISLAELKALYKDVKQISPVLATFSSSKELNDFSRLGGTLKVAIKLNQKPLDYLATLPKGKITIGISDYSTHASRQTATSLALKLKKILVRHGRSVRVVANKEAALSTATSLHNGLSGANERKAEFIKVNSDWYRTVFIQDIESYAARDQGRPARDAKVGMLPPKLAQILINLCGLLPKGATILDPFCGTGVILQESLLMGYHPYGTDLSDRMVDYSKKNLKWLQKNFTAEHEQTTNLPSDLAEQSVFVGDATTFKWQTPIDAIACECYLGSPMSQIPSELKLKAQKQECSDIILSFLKNLATQITPKTPVTIAVPAWLRENNEYSRLNIIDEIEKLGYNVNNKTREGLLYCRKGQIVARDILILRKK
ncbi:hypothetical protein IKG38_03960 [Candidatus Saccharibacteria bacterium]|nr:hypothetical protein [Candidatus Saccharibacteria bacterium]